MNNKKIPTEAKSESEILDYLQSIKKEDVQWEAGRCWGLAYWYSEQHRLLSQKAFDIYAYENMACPAAFPSVKILEHEIVSMMSDLLHGNPDTSGSVTSGGTESNLLAVKAYRDYARKHKTNIKTPEIIVAESVHPSFLKAAQYFDLHVKTATLDTNYRMDIEQLKHTMSDNTILIVASAPNLYYGSCDPIEGLSEIATSHGIGLHIDACLGGLFFPFIEEGAPDYDFRLPGVSSISSDIHKYGYSLKGLSTILYREKSLHRYQYFVDEEHMNTAYGSPVMQGSRSAGTLAAGWASLHYLGKTGFRKIVKELKEKTQYMTREINTMEEFSVLGEPEMSVFSFTSNSLNISSIYQRLIQKGWYIERQANPDSIRLVMMPVHFKQIDSFLQDLKKAAQSERTDPLASTTNDKPFLYGSPE